MRSRTTLLSTAAAALATAALLAVPPATTAGAVRAAPEAPTSLAGRGTAIGHWVDTWVSAQQLTEPHNLPPAPFQTETGVFTDATLRQTIMTTLGGPQIRVSFSNEYGGTDLSITSAAVALPAAGKAGAAAIVPDSSRAVTFGGRRGVVVPVGARVVSDPLPFPVAPNTNLTVTMYLAQGQQSLDVTSHPGSRTTSWIAAGNRLDTLDLPGATGVLHWYYLSSVEVWAGRSAAAVSVVGDSLTDGRGSTNDANDRWTNALASRLARTGATKRVAVLNEAAGGGRVLHDGLGTSAWARFDRDVLARSGIAWALVFEGINDIGTAEATAAAQDAVADQLILAYDQLITRGHARGVRVYGATLLPFDGNTGYDDPDGFREAARAKVNTWIRTSGRFDGVADFDRAVRDAKNPLALDPRYDGGDHLHLNPEGYRVLAEAVPTSFFTARVSPEFGPQPATR